MRQVVAIAMGLGFVAAMSLGVETVNTVSDAGLQGTLSALDKDELVVTLADGATKRFALGDLLSVGFGNAEEKPKGLCFVLHNGDRLHGPVTKGEGATVTIGTAGGGVTLELGKIRRVENPATIGAETAATVASLEPDKDMAFLSGGQKTPGTIQSFGTNSFTFKTELGDLPIEYKTLEAVAVAKTQDAFQEPKTFLAVVELTDGTRVSGALEAVTAETLTIKSVAGFTLSVPRAKLARLLAKNGRVVFLSDLEPTKVEEQAWALSTSDLWKFRKDRSVLGTPLSVAGVRYERGLGVHAASQLTFALNRQYKEFRATVGIDDSVKETPAAPAAAVLFEVRGDGKPLYQSKAPATLAAAAATLRIPVEGVAVLQLVVSYGPDNSMVGDRADWADAKLVK